METMAHSMAFERWDVEKAQALVLFLFLTSNVRLILVTAIAFTLYSICSWSEFA